MVLGQHDELVHIVSPHVAGLSSGQWGDRGNRGIQVRRARIDVNGDGGNAATAKLQSSSERVYAGYYPANHRQVVRWWDGRQSAIEAHQQRGLHAGH